VGRAFVVQDNIELKTAGTFVVALETEAEVKHERCLGHAAFSGARRHIGSRKASSRRTVIYQQPETLTWLYIVQAEFFVFLGLMLESPWVPTIVFSTHLPTFSRVL